jgi:hypothetical protein
MACTRAYSASRRSNPSPSGVPFPASATLANGQVNFTAKFPAAGYYPIEARGPNGTVGWVTVDVGVNPNTAP